MKKLENQRFLKFSGGIATKCWLKCVKLSGLQSTVANKERMKKKEKRYHMFDITTVRVRRLVC